jgi:hypothetical protein
MDTYEDNEYWNETQRTITPLFLYKPTHPVKFRDVDKEIKHLDFSYMMVVIESLELDADIEFISMNFMVWELCDNDECSHDSKVMSFLKNEKKKISWFLSAPTRTFGKHEVDILKFENSPLSLKEIKRYTDKWKKASAI